MVKDRARYLQLGVWLCALLVLATSAAAQEYEWSVLKLGAGGWLTGLDIAPDGTRVVRADTYGAYRWNGSQWVQLLTMDAMPSGHKGIDYNTGVYELRIAPSDSDVMYMAFQGYVYRTADAGGSWAATAFTQVSDMDPNDDYRFFGEKLAVDPANEDVVLVGTAADGLFYTDDGGSSWSSVGDVPAGAGPGITGICFDDTSSVVDGKTQVMFASSGGQGIYRSTDGGANWSDLGGTPDEAQHATCANGTYYVTDNSGDGHLWRWSGSWVDIDPEATEDAHSITVDPNDPDHLVAAALSGHMRISWDNGSTWDVTNYPGLRAATDITWLEWTTETYMSNGDMQFDPDVANKVWFAQGIGVWHTTLETEAPQGNVNWVESAVGIEQLVTRNIAAPPGKSTIHIGTWDRGVFSTSDVDTFPSVHGPVQGFNNGWWVGYAATDPDFLVTVDNHDDDYNASSDDDGATWDQLTDTAVECEGGTGAASTSSNFVVVCANNGPAYYTTNGGSSWTAVSLPGTTNNNYIFAFFLNSHIVTADHVTSGKFWLYKSGVGLFRTTDGGANWSNVYGSEIASGSNFNAKLRSVPGQEDHLFFTSGSQGNLGDSNPGSSGLMRSTDGGENWSAVTDMLEVYDFGFGDDQEGGYPSIFAAGWYDSEWGIWRSDDETATWTKIGDFPLGSFDKINAVEGAKDGTDRVFVGFTGSGAAVGTPPGTTPGSRHEGVTPQGVTYTLHTPERDMEDRPLAGLRFCELSVRINAGEPQTYRYRPQDPPDLSLDAACGDEVTVVGTCTGMDGAVSQEYRSSERMAPCVNDTRPKPPQVSLRR